MKVFLSHSTQDKDFVQQLSAAIIGAGSETWLCELDVALHANFVAEIERGLKLCEVGAAHLVPRRRRLQMDRRGMDLCPRPPGR